VIDPCTHFDSTGRCEIHPKEACPGHCASYDDGQHLEFMSVAQMFARIGMWQKVTAGEDLFNEPAQAQAGSFSQEPGSV
jgi:hypothetical protein